MARIPTAELRRYLLTGQIPRRNCLRCKHFSPTRRDSSIPFPSANRRQYGTVSSTPSSSSSASSPSNAQPIIPLRKQLKDAAKAAPPKHQQNKKQKVNNQTVPGWELTVGIEIHTQLNTRQKLFSPSLSLASSSTSAPNTAAQVSPFDLAIPGSQPLFQPATLIPAIRAALALNCAIQRTSRFDRKHYFHWDQPSGYQITQYYKPFARDGYLELYARDGIAREDGEVIRVGIKQVQMEQDTGKTTMVSSEREGENGEGEATHWVDFNRVGVPLIEIITEPVIHHPATAAAFVRKVQALLYAVDACVSGMESGGLRADVNVSVRREDDPTSIKKMGTRTEIKNLSSFKAVEDAIMAERDRQIKVLEEGGTIKGETRGWSLGSVETRRLRGKEGEVDYRYMPDPDLGSVVIDDTLIRYLGESMGKFPDREIDDLVGRYGLTTKDAMSLMGLDDGARVEYFYKVLEQLEERLGLATAAEGQQQQQHQGEVQSESREMKQREQQHALLAANWCLHELGKLTEVSSDLGMTPQGECAVPSMELATILAHLYRKEITAKVAKELLWAVFRGDVDTETGGVTGLIEQEGLWFQELTEEEYAGLADEAVEGQGKVLGEFVGYYKGLVEEEGKKGPEENKKGKGGKYPQGKLMFLVGRMLRAGPEEKMDPASAERVMRRRLEEVYVPAHGAVAGMGER